MSVRLLSICPSVRLDSGTSGSWLDTLELCFKKITIPISISKAFCGSFHFSSGMAQATVKILKGFEDTPLTNDKAEDLMEWMDDLVGESLENDTNLKEVSVSFRKPNGCSHFFSHIS